MRLKSGVTVLCLCALLFACTGENDKNENKNPHEKTSKAVTTESKMAEYVKNYNPKDSNLIGAYLSARMARIHYDFDAATVHAVRAFELDKTGDIFIRDQGIRLSIARGDVKEAIVLAHKILEQKDIKNVTPFVVLVALIDAIEKKDGQQAISLIKKYGDNHLNLPVRSLIGGMAYRLSGDVKQAERLENSLQGFELFDFLKLYHQSLVAMVDGRIDDAINIAKKAEKFRDPMAARAAFGLAFLEAKKGDKDATKKTLAKAVARHPDKTLKAAQDAFAKGKALDYEEAKNYAEVTGESLYNIGIVYARERDYETALAFFSMANYLAPNKSYIWSITAETYAMIRDYKKSAEFYAKLVDKEDIIARDSVLNTVYALNADDRFEDAQKLLLDVIAKDDAYFRYYHTLGDILRGQEKFAEALPYYDKALSLLTKKQEQFAWRIYYVRGIVYERLGQWDKAEKDLLKAVELVPNNADVINYLAYSWIDRGENIERAFIMLDKAVRRSPENGYIVDSLGWAYFKLGQYDKAVEILGRALELTPGDVVVNEHLGDAFWQVGRKREAEFQWLHALDFKPTSVDKKRIKQKIELGLDVYLAKYEKNQVPKGVKEPKKKPEDNSNLAQDKTASEVHERNIQ